MLTRLRTMDMNLLIALDALLQEQSVKRAARRVGITPSAMSHTLARLRELFNDQLLLRSGRQMIPTVRAESLMGPLQELLLELEALLVPPEMLSPKKLKRSFRIVTTDHTISVLQPALERVLAKEAPLVDVYMCPLTASTMEELRSGAIDLAIGVFPGADAEMRSRRLFDDRFVVMARNEHPVLSEEPMSIERYLDMWHLLVSPRGSPEGIVDQVLAKEGLKRRVARTLPHFLAAAWIVAETDFIVTISALLARRVAQHLPLTIYEPPLLLPSYTLRMLWHPRRDKEPAHIWFRDILTRTSAAMEREEKEGVKL